MGDLFDVIRYHLQVHTAFQWSFYFKCSNTSCFQRGQVPSRSNKLWQISSGEAERTSAIEIGRNAWCDVGSKKGIPWDAVVVVLVGKEIFLFAPLKNSNVLDTMFRSIYKDIYIYIYI